MIITRSPLRISLSGGGTDPYYLEFGGFLVAAAIDKYVYITLHRTFVQELICQILEAGASCFGRSAGASDHSRGDDSGV